MSVTYKQFKTNGSFSSGGLLLSSLRVLCNLTAWPHCLYNCVAKIGFVPVSQVLHSIWSLSYDDVYEYGGGGNLQLAGSCGLPGSLTGYVTND